MSRLGFDEQGRALDGQARDEAVETDPLKLAARAQSADVQAARAAIERDATRENIAELLRHATHLPDASAALLGGTTPIWDRWVAILEGAALDLAARRDLVTVTQRLPEPARVMVLERVFRVPLGGDARATDGVDDLLEDAAGQPIPDAESAAMTLDGTLHLDGPEALVDDLFDPAPTTETLVTSLAPTAQAGLADGGVERQMDVTGFVRACAAPGVAVDRAVAVLNARFGGGPPLDDEPRWWRQVARLQRRFPALVEALEAAQRGAPQTVAIRGGYARVDLSTGRLGVYSPASAPASRS